MTKRDGHLEVLDERQSEVLHRFMDYDRASRQSVGWPLEDNLIAALLVMAESWCRMIDEGGGVEACARQHLEYQRAQRGPAH